MSNDKDYTELSLEALLKEKKKIKNQEITGALLIGLSFGVMIYGIVKNGFGFLYIFLPSFLIYGVYKNSQNLKQNLKLIQEEINNKTVE